MRYALRVPAAPPLPAYVSDSVLSRSAIFCFKRSQFLDQDLLCLLWFSSDISVATHCTRMERKKGNIFPRPFNRIQNKPCLSHSSSPGTLSLINPVHEGLMSSCDLYCASPMLTVIIDVITRHREKISSLSSALCELCNILQQIIYIFCHSLTLSCRTSIDRLKLFIKYMWWVTAVKWR